MIETPIDDFQDMFENAPCGYLTLLTNGRIQRVNRTLLGWTGHTSDQMTGKRGGSDTDGGLSGRIYAMLAQEMSDTRNRGRIIWIFATSRPDLVEVDLKLKDARIDVLERGADAPFGVVVEVPQWRRQLALWRWARTH